MARNKITYGVGARGTPIGEAHPGAVLSDSDVELIRDIYEEGMVGYDVLARVFNVSKSTIRDIVTFRRRATTPTGYRTVDASKRRPLPKSRLEQLGVDPNAIEPEWDDH